MYTWNLLRPYFSTNFNFNINFHPDYFRILSIRQFSPPKPPKKRFFMIRHASFRISNNDNFTPFTWLRTFLYPHYREKKFCKWGDFCLPSRATFPHRFKPFQLETVMLDEDQVVIYNSKKAKLSMAPFLERAKVSTVHTGVGEQPQRIMGAAALEQRRRLRADEQRIFNGREFEKRGEGAVKRFPIILLRLHVFTSAKPELCCS